MLVSHQLRLFVNATIVAIWLAVLSLAPAFAFSSLLIEPSSDEDVSRFLPDGSAISAQTIVERTEVTTNVPFGDYDLEYSIRLPKDWKPSKFTQFGEQKQDKYEVPTNIARYFGTSIVGVLPYLWIEAYRPKQEILLEDYVGMFMRKRGITPKAALYENAERIQITYIELEGAESFIKRSLFLLHGDKIVHVQFVIPFSSFQDMRSLVGLVLNSFKLTKVPEGELEPTKSTALLNVLKFDYPASWSEEYKSEESALYLRSVLHRYDFREVLQGLISVDAIRKTELRTVPTEMARIRRSLERSGITIGEQLQSLSFPKSSQRSHYKFQTIEVYKAEKVQPEKVDEFGLVIEDAAKIDQEVWIAVAENTSHILIGLMVTTDRGTSFRDWALNRAALVKILETVNLRND